VVGGVIFSYRRLGVRTRGEWTLDFSGGECLDTWERQSMMMIDLSLVIIRCEGGRVSYRSVVLYCIVDRRIAVR